METKRICSFCGKTLAANAPEGLCPECLLKAGLGSGVDIGPDTEAPADDLVCELGADAIVIKSFQPKSGHGTAQLVVTAIKFKN